MKKSPILPTLPLEKSIELFTEQARSAIVSRNIFARLFEEKPCGEAGNMAMHKTSPFLFEWLNMTLLEYALLQASKLLDPAETKRNGQSRRNITCDYIYFIHPDCAVKNQLKALNLEEFYPYISKARNRLIAHSDEEAVAAQCSLGGFPPEVGDRFYVNLQKFVNILHDGLHPLQDDMILNDVNVLILKLIRANKRT